MITPNIKNWIISTYATMDSLPAPFEDINACSGICEKFKDLEIAILPYF
jgi:hypothetical protein